MFIIPKTIDNSGRSVLGCLDARLNLLLLPMILINIFVISSERFWHALLTVIIIITLMALSRIRVNWMIKKLLLFYPMVLFFTIPLFLQVSDWKTISQLSSLNDFLAFLNSINVFLIVQLKYILSLILLFSFTAGIKSGDVIQALQFFKLSDWILAILQYISQLIRILGLEFERIRIAYQSRAVKPGLILKIKTIAGLVYVLTIRIIERSENIFLAMLSRGFKGKFHISGKLKWKISDTLILVFIVLFTIWPFIPGVLD